MRELFGKNCPYAYELPFEILRLPGSKKAAAKLSFCFKWSDTGQRTVLLCAAQEVRDLVRSLPI